ncbi:hypothetical protein CCH79_00014460 [Gambusia affinis]|uniref:Uncharacterized protein n=1 Tax=Gambusia affinis TaxID=33528 RepID=A0A315UTA6_GAMAF|nr:hypothetical protein CCH79_00014460 [Gambusia affinis]
MKDDCDPTLGLGQGYWKRWTLQKSSATATTFSLWERHRALMSVPSEPSNHTPANHRNTGISLLLIPTPQQEQTSPITSYRGTVESKLTSSIPVWFVACNTSDRQRIQRVVRTAERIIRPELPSILDTASSRSLTRARPISKDFSQPHHSLFSLLPSDPRFNNFNCRTIRFHNSLTPHAIRLLNSRGIPGEYLMTDSCSFPSVDSEITSLVTKSRTTHLSELKGEADGQGAARSALQRMILRSFPPPLSRAPHFRVHRTSPMAGCCLQSLRVSCFPIQAQIEEAANKMEALAHH